MSPADIPPGINYERVSRYFAQHIPGGDVSLTFTVISGGRSNLTYRVEGGGRDWVLRRPPLGHILPTAHDMAREYRIISALSPTGVPVPGAVALCTDPEVNDHPFYVMEFVDGVIINEEMPEGYVETPEARRALSNALVDALVQLHTVDYAAAGLSDFGRPAGYLERQVRRWGEQWERSRTRELPEVDEVIRRLNASVPPSPAPSIVHGDFRLGNMILGREAPERVEALLDWEMATLGDPLTDLGYTLVYWGQEGDPERRWGFNNIATITMAPGFMTRSELISEYSRRSGINVDHVDFYEVFGFYKLAVILEGIWARHLAGETVGEGFETMGDDATKLAAMALELSSQSSDPRLRGE